MSTILPPNIPPPRRGSREHTQSEENKALRRILWAVIKSQGGRISVPQRVLLHAPVRPKFGSTLDNQGALWMWPDGEEP